MSFQVTFYNFAKRPNSTKVPSSAGSSYNCIIKDGSGILNPTIELELPINQTPLWNYAWISAFGRYYWVCEWTYQNRLWTATLTVDPLASNKSAIGDATLYVLRAASDKDGAVIDNYYPIKMTCTTDSTDQTEASWWALSPAAASGAFIVGIRGKIDNTQDAGGVTYLVMTAAQFKTFCSTLFDDTLNNYTFGTPLTDISDSLAMMIFNPADYITGAIWLPSTPSNVQAATNVWRLGWWDLGMSLPILKPASELTYTATINLTQHPDAATRGMYLNGSPYTQRVLQLPRAGLITLDDPIIADAAANSGHVTVYLRVDPISGEGIYTISCKGVTLDRIHCQIGVNVPLSNNNITFQEAAAPISTAASGAVAAAAGDVVGAAMHSAAAVGSAIGAFQPHITDLSSASGYLGLVGAGFCTIFSIFRDITEDDNTEHGRPLCKNKKISTLSGYIQVLNGDLEISTATRSELDEIRSNLEGGFYYE